MSDAPNPAPKVSTYQVKQFVDPKQAKADLGYSPLTLDNAYMEQASRFLEYSSLAAAAAKQVDDLKLLLEQAEARVYRKLRDEIVGKGEKVTEAQLEKMVAVHETVVKFKKALNEAKQVEAVAKGAVEAFKQRRDMLIQHGASERTERQGELRLKGIEANNAALDDQRARIKDRLTGGTAS